MVSTLVPPKVCVAVENLVNIANSGYRSPLPTYVLLSPLPFSSERSRNPTAAHSKLSWIDKTRMMEELLAIQGLRKADRLDSRPLAVPPMLRACRGLLLSTRSFPVALPRLLSPRA
jgi:hypothetical protein